MDLTLFTLLALVLVGLFSGFLGALVGIGGGVIIIPALVLAFGLDIKIAVATSLIAVVATSTSAGSVYVGKGLSNLRLGMCLEIATTLGGLSGGLLALWIPSSALAILFALMMVVTATLMLRSREPVLEPTVSKTSLHEPHFSSMGHEESGRLAGTYYDSFHRRLIHYEVQQLPLGAGISFLAGIVSGMLGVGGGFIKVPAMTLGMKVPIKVAAATSNFMIGVTAVSSLFVYFDRGFIHPFIAAPVAIGISGGALAGAAYAHKVSPQKLRFLLALVLIGVAVQMMLKGLGVGFGA